jgi:hypothetical protein
VTAIAGDLAAPWTGGAVTVRSDGAVDWQGFDLTAAAAVVIERPLFPWPQPQRLETLLVEGAPVPEQAAAERESRALALSALRWAAERVPVLNPPLSAHLAAAPVEALGLASEAGLEVFPWRLAPAPDSEQGDGELVLDCVGRELWHEPARPEPGQPALLLESPPEAALEIVGAGPTVVAARRFSDCAAWSAGDGTTVEPPATAAGIALRAVKAAGLFFGSVTLESGAPHRLLWVDAAPDLERLDRATEGGLVAAIAASVLALAAAKGKTA